MDTIETIHHRRSIRNFKPDEVESGLITQVLEAGRLAPSSTNTQPWKFVVVRSADAREALCEAAYGQKMIRQAPVVVVALGDRKRFRKWLRRSKELVDIGAVSDDVVNKVREVYKDRAKMSGEDPDRKITANCMIAIDHMTLAATSLGLGTCWVMLMKVDEVARLLRLPDSVYPVALMPMGYAIDHPSPRPRYPLDEVAFDEDLEHGWGREE
ncbi:MAG: nitroreductase family protein [Pirellulales bacterium]|nr:nitroreductase family protein [Pirellulales bacterium]